MIYVDAGYYAGVAERLNCVGRDWAKYGFEPNPGIEVPPWVKRKAAWIKGGKVKFNVGGRDDSASIDGTSGHAEGVPQIEVPAFDFSKFIGNLPDEPIVCSMDIEGAEFKVLAKMIDDGTAGKLTFLDVEFHHRLMNDYTAEDAQALIDKLQQLGVIVRLKIEL